LAPTGLKQPCRIRLKIFTLDERLLLGRLGELAEVDREGVGRKVRDLLPWMG
jgi:mRNA interferase MazF